MFISNITIHHWNNFSENDLAVIKLKNRIEFDDLYLGYSKLPDDEIKMGNFNNNNCFISGYIKNTNGDVQVYSIEVEILRSDECVDLAIINNITFIDKSCKYCVLTQRTEQKAVLYANGKGIICKNTISAMMTPIFYEFHNSLLIPVLDVGKKSTWFWE
nr:uncharacterized protein LOC111419228 [Onthophagus taurus]